MWWPSQSKASPACKSFFAMLLETEPIVDVVSPGLLSCQHIETNPEQSVL